MFDTSFLIGGAALLGLVVGSFLNVVIHRLPKMMENEWREQCAELSGGPAPVTARYNLLMPRSQCPACQGQLRARDNIPVVSWVLLGGKCARCKARISPRYPLVELLTALLSAVIAWKFGPGWSTAAFLVLTWTLIALTFIDADTTLLPDDLTLPLLWLGLLVNLIGLVPGVSLRDAVIGAAAGYLVLWSIYWVFRIMTGKEGMGYGDFKLLSALGAWLGYKALLPVLLLSSVVGAVIGIALMVLARRGRDIPIPFGPYLAAAGFLVLVLGDRVTGMLQLT